MSEDHEVNKTDAIKRFLVDVMINNQLEYYSDYVCEDVYAIDLYMQGLLTYTDRYRISDEGRAWLERHK